MPIKYIGRTTDFKGKPLWEIVGNLQNFGVGRIVYRNMFQRYPEPSYMKILKVAALPETEGARKVIALIQKTFRGKTDPKHIQIDSSTYKADFILVPKHEEAAFCRLVDPHPERILPRTMEYPPLLRKLVLRQMNEAVTEDPKMLIIYSKNQNKISRIAKEGETPNVEIKLGIGETTSPKLYANIKKEPNEPNVEK